VTAAVKQWPGCSGAIEDGVTGGAVVVAKVDWFYGLSESGQQYKLRVEAE